MNKKKENISNSSFKPVRKPIFKFSRRVMVLLSVAANRDFQFISREKLDWRVSSVLVRIIKRSNERQAKDKRHRCADDKRM